MRQFSGFAPGGDQSALPHLLDYGSGGLSVAFDLPTLMGYDSDLRRAKAKSVSAEWRLIRSKIWKFSFAGIDLEKT